MHSIFLTTLIVVFETLFKEKREQNKQENRTDIIGEPSCFLAQNSLCHAL